MDKYNVKWIRILTWNKSFAITLGQTAYYPVPESEVSVFWRKHEETHKIQWKEFGWKFPFMYLWESIRHGYMNNKYEVQARNAASLARNI